MKQIFLLVMLFSAANAAWAAEKKSGDQWKNTTLSDENIEHIQKAKYQYKQCIADEMQKKNYAKMDSRVATDQILKKCEKDLSHIRTVLNKEKVPETTTDRYLKQTRTQTARKVLQELMFAEAARKAGQ